MYMTTSEKANTPMFDPIFVVIRFGSADKLFVSGVQLKVSWRPYATPQYKQLQTGPGSPVQPETLSK